jgi:hypothetical protein
MNTSAPFGLEVLFRVVLDFSRFTVTTKASILAHSFTFFES